MHPQLYVPMMMQPIVRPPSAGYSGDRDPDLLMKPNGWLSAIGRLRAGVTLEQARDELNAVLTARSAHTAAVPPSDATTPRQVSLPVDDGDPGDRRQLHSTAWLLGGVVGGCC